MTDPFTALKSPQMADMNADADDADADAGALGIEYFLYGMDFFRCCGVTALYITGHYGVESSPPRRRALFYGIGFDGVTTFPNMLGPRERIC